MSSEITAERRDAMQRRTITLDDVRSGNLDKLSDSFELSKLLLEWNPDGHRTRSTDIGSYCYSIRLGNNNYLSVDPSSLISHELLPNVVLGTLRLLAEKPDPSATSCLSYLARILHADNAGELEDAIGVLQIMNRLLRTELENGKKRIGTLINLERASIAALCHGFNVPRESLIYGVRLLRNWKHTVSERRELSQDAGAAISRAAADHFLDVTKAILEDKPIPFKISVDGKEFLVTASHAITKGLPRYLPLDENGHPPPTSVYGSDLRLRKFSSPRFGTGRPDDEVRRLRNEYSIAAYEKRRSAIANSDQLSDVRRRLIAEALLSFCIYTYFDTGANVTTLQGKIRDGIQQDAVLVSEIVAGDGTLALSAERGIKGYLLAAEKPRAGNKRIPIVFSSIWVKRMLPIYLRLRDHLLDLDVSVPENLIFSLLDPARNNYAVARNPRISQRLKANCGHILNRVLHKHGMERISMQQIRNYKSVSISRTHGPSASANLLGHSLETSLKHYNRVEEAEAQLQLSNSLNKIMSIAIVSAGDPESRRLPSGGACTKSDTLPAVAVVSDDLGLHSPNCHTRTGCWMCPHFAIHADKEDIWKMKSYLFVIDELRANSLDPAGVAAVHKPIVNRLMDLCDRIVSESTQLADAASGIDRLITDGQLHPIYRSLLDTYEKVNLI